MKDVISKRNKPGSRLPTKFAINKDDVTSEIGIPNEFNKFFTKIGPELARKVSTTSRIFESFLNKIGTTKPADPISIMDLKKLFFHKNKQKPRSLSNIVIRILPEIALVI